MKAALSLLVLVATISLARAGEFAGPPPFTNDSPLQSGTDGTYQAIISGTNVTGVFSFVISGGLQTSDQSATINSWVFFVDGNIFRGSVVAAISRRKDRWHSRWGSDRVTVRKWRTLGAPFRICHSRQHSVRRI